LTAPAAEAILDQPVRAPLRLRLILAVLVVAELALVALVTAGALAAGPRIDDVEDSLAHDRSFKVRFDAAAVLGRLRQTRSVPVLVGALLKDPVAAVRVAAAHALGQIGSPIAREALQKAQQDPAPGVRQMAREALQLLGSAEPPPEPSGNGPAIHARGGTPMSFEVKPMGDRSHRASPALRSHMRDFLIGQLRPLGDVEAREHEGRFAVDGVIKALATEDRGIDVEVSCTVQLTVSRQPGGGIFLLTSGEATVAKPKRQWKPQHKVGMELEALESAVRAASEDLVHHLVASQ
jgi:HEAT repeat protein